MIVIIVGPQGSGKGTQAELMSQRLGYFHMESGKMLREMAKKDERIARYLSRGELVPDEETVEYIDKYLKQESVGEDIVFDGFPRTVRQYGLLKEWLGRSKKEVDLVVYVDVSEEETIRRLSARRTCSSCGEVYNLITNPPPSGACKCGGELVQREDDEPETIKKRLEVFANETKPMIEEIEREGILTRIDGERPIEEIFEDIAHLIGGKSE